jgi:hypothetical protein
MKYAFLLTALLAVIAMVFLLFWRNQSKQKKLGLSAIDFHE